MNFYERRIFPWLNDKLTVDPDLTKIRIDALCAARGRVVEIGFGSGRNLAYYPSEVTSVVGVEPNDGMRDRAKPSIRASRIPIEMIEEAAERLPLQDRSIDTAVSMLTLCSVSNPGRVLTELHRVLRDDGRLIIVEHGLSEDPDVARWQNRLNRLQNVVGCGCNLNRPMVNLVENHGFRFDTLRRLFVPRIPRTHGWFTIGTAVKA